MGSNEQDGHRPQEERLSPAARYLERIGEGTATQPQSGWRARGYEIIFKADTPAGKAFDLWLIAAILVSVAVVMAETVASIDARHGVALRVVEWGFTALFTVEYVLRLMCSPKPGRYALGFWGLVDLFSIVPSFVSILFAPARGLLVIRTLRILRLFQILKLGRYVSELDALQRAVRQGARKILVFLYSVSTLVLILGAIMYLAESDESGFTSIPRSVYWAIVTMTTVGYGDISPSTPIGQTIAALVMLMGYSIIVIPTGILSAEFFRSNAVAPLSKGQLTSPCPTCGSKEHLEASSFCNRCGSRLEQEA